MPFELSLPGHPILAGVVGSQAYGLATPASDTDTLGIYVTPTLHHFRLNPPAETVIQKISADGVFVGDATWHEVAKFARLALKCNPTVLELLWLPEYTEREAEGQMLLDIRSAFLSAKYVRDAYLGYATQQFRRLETRSDGSFSADTRKRTAKHARHLMRLLHQGVQLYTTGRLPIMLDNPEDYFAFGEEVAAGKTDLADVRIREAVYIFDTATTVLPEQPNVAAVEKWIIDVRMDNLE